MVFGAYAPQTSAGGMRAVAGSDADVAAGAGLLDDLCCRVHALFWGGPDQRTAAAVGRNALRLRRGCALGLDPPSHPQDRPLHGLRNLFPGLLSRLLD